jgi:hypothetical protein
MPIRRILPAPSKRLVCGIIEKDSWLGRQDSNLGMAVPKTAALPLGDAPTAAVFNQGGVGLQGVFGTKPANL